jgi:hypothetical protein
VSPGVVTTEQVILGGGIRSVNFFNGRLLTGEDLTREQEANALARLRLGRTLGLGVASGLGVAVAPTSTNARPVVTVAPGLACNLDGRVLELPGATDVALTRERTGAAGAEVLFEDCAPLQPGSYSAGAGVYVLTIGPALAGEGRAKVSGLGNDDAACNTAYSIEGVQFHLLRIALPPQVLTPAGQLRNRVAHLLLGTEDPRRAALDRDVFGAPATSYGLVDDLRAAGCIGSEQVPLAVLAWTSAQGLQFVDVWAVRRRLVHRPADPGAGDVVADRRDAEALATFLQFQAHVADLMAINGALPNVAAADRFALLPPLGIVPITGPAGTPGFDPQAFLGDQGSDELATLDAAQLRVLVAESLTHRPVRAGSGGPRIQRYVVWENELASEAGGAHRALVFAAPTLPYRGTARYGRARFGRSRFAPSVI